MSTSSQEAVQEVAPAPAVIPAPAPLRTGRPRARRRRPLVLGLLAVGAALLVLVGAVLTDTRLERSRAVAPAAVLAADRYAARSVDVADLWTGLSADGTPRTRLPDAALHEPSGLAVSRTNPGAAYVTSESDVRGMVAVSLQTARVVGRYTVAIPDPWDWEDVATGPCPSGSCLFAADIGRSNGRSDPPSTFAVYRVPEPDFGAGQTSGELRGDLFRFRYPDAPHDAEALMVHPGTGRVYVVTKERSGRAGVYAFPAELPPPSSRRITTLDEVGTLEVPPVGPDASTEVSAAAVHPAGDRFLVRTTSSVLEYRAPAGEPFENAFDAEPVALTAPSGEPQGEAVDYAADGSAYYTVGEAERPPFTLKRVDAL